MSLSTTIPNVTPAYWLPPPGPPQSDYKTEFEEQFRDDIILMSRDFVVWCAFMTLVLYLFDKNSTEITLVVFFMIGLLITNVIFYPWIFPLIEIIKNECLYKFINLQPPLFVYQSNRKFDNMYECHICSKPFIHYINSHKNKNEETILKCGHRFHQKCLREIEIKNVVDNDSLYYIPRYYKCFICNIRYDWKQKWVYQYMEINFDKIRDETLMTCLCQDIENKIIEYI